MKRRIRFAFRRNAKGFVSWAIRKTTRSEHGISHVEFVAEDGMSFSSREPKGTAWKLIDYFTTEAEWAFVDFYVSQAEYEAALAVCRDYDGLPYDFPGIARFWLATSRQSWLKFSNRWQFCSEVCTRIAHACGLALHCDPNLTSPQRLFDVLAAHPDSTVTGV